MHKKIKQKKQAGQMKHPASLTRLDVFSDNSCLVPSCDELPFE